METLFPLLFLLIVGVVVATFVISHRGRKRREAAYAALLSRDRTLTPTTAPCGFGPDALLRYDGIDRGDRRYGVRYGVEGPLPVQVAGVDAGVRCAAFQWWYEQRSQSKNGTSYHERTCPVVIAELPVELPVTIVLRPESLLGRAGLTRADQQLESTAFNRAFRVRSTNERLSVKLLDANLQTLLPQAFDRRTIELTGRHVVLTGRPRHRDESLEGVIGELPAIRQDLQHLLANVPAQFWRAVGADPHAPPADGRR